nr:resistin [Loxodonta africana]
MKAVFLLLLLLPVLGLLVSGESRCPVDAAIDQEIQRGTISLILEAFNGLRLDCQSVTSRGDLATCPAGFLCLNPQPPPPPQPQHPISLCHWCPGPRPPDSLPAYPHAFDPLVWESPATWTLIPIPAPAPGPSLLLHSYPQVSPVTGCACGYGCGSWDVRAETTCHCQCQGMDWTTARCCRMLLSK